MIARLTGNLASKEPNRLIIDVGGVGYQVFVPLSTFYALPETGRQVSLTIHTHVTGDSISLYGFATSREQALFELLIGVSRIGPKLATNILSGIQPVELARALAQGDAVRLTAIPGVGKKAAERMIVELKDKAAALAWPDGETPSTGPPPGDALFADAVSALANLGYNRAQAERAIKAVLEGMDGRPSLEELLKEVLRRLAK